ncbi:tetratricopeptide repeat protein [Acidobacteriota bacterium]
MKKDGDKSESKKQALDQVRIGKGFEKKGALNSLVMNQTSIKVYRDQALTCYNKAIELDPECLQAHLARYRILVNLDRCAEAEVDLKRAVALAPDDPEVYLSLSFRFPFDQKARELAKKGLKVLDAPLTENQRNTAYQLNFHIALSYWYEGEIKTCIEYQQEAVDCARGGLYYSTSLSFIGMFFEANGQFARAEQAFQEAVDHASTAEKIEEYVSLGRLYYRWGRLEDSRSAFSMALSFPQSRQDIRYDVALVEMASGIRPEELDSLISSLEKSRSRYSYYQFTLAMMYLLRGDRTDAYKEFQAFVDRNLHHPREWGVTLRYETMISKRCMKMIELGEGGLE